MDWACVGVLDDLLVSLDDDYGGDEPSEKTSAMLEAEKAFLEVMKKEYMPWRCDIVTRKTIDIAEWRKTHPQ